MIVRFSWFTGPPQHSIHFPHFIVYLWETSLSTGRWNKENWCHSCNVIPVIIFRGSLLHVPQTHLFRIIAHCVDEISLVNTNAHAKRFRNCFTSVMSSCFMNWYYTITYVCGRWSQRCLFRCLRLPLLLFLVYQRPHSCWNLMHLIFSPNLAVRMVLLPRHFQIHFLEWKFINFD